MVDRSTDVYTISGLHYFISVNEIIKIAAAVLPNETFNFFGFN